MYNMPMREKYAVSKKFIRRTNCLDIAKLERENQKFFYIGFVVGILFITALAPFIKYKKNIYIIQPE